MIGFLKGVVQDINGQKIIISTASGVGYEVFTSMNLLGNVQEGKSVGVYIHTIVREQEISLYGFLEKEEKIVFEKLIGISGIGPKIGMQIIAGPVDLFFTAVENGDIGTITQTPGIGKKMAQKIIVELQGKLDLTPTASTNISRPKAEATDALVNLGYDRNIVQDILSSASPSADTETLVKFFLASNG